MKNPIPGLLVGLGAGAGAGVILFVITFFLTFTICSDTSIAEKMFPFSLIVVPSIFAHPFVALVLALIQFPLYGIVLGFTWVKAGSTKAIFIAAILVGVVIHLAAGSFATRRVETMWQQKFAQAGY